MGNIKAVIDLSEELYLSLSSLDFTKERIANESRRLLGLKYFKEKALSLGKAAELSGLSKWNFIEYPSENGIPVIDDDEMIREFKTVEKLTERLKKWLL